MTHSTYGRLWLRFPITAVNVLCASEAERVSQCGGEVRPSNTGAMRLYGKGLSHTHTRAAGLRILYLLCVCGSAGSPGPALAVTRAFGDTAGIRNRHRVVRGKYFGFPLSLVHPSATRCGVTHEPEIACYPLKSHTSTTPMPDFSLMPVHGCVCVWQGQ